MMRSGSTLIEQIIDAHPEAHGAETRSDALSPQLDVLPELLSQHGYEVAAIVANPNRGSFYGFANLTRVNNLRTQLESVPDEFQVPPHLLRAGYEDLLLDPETGEARWRTERDEVTS